MSEIQFHFVSKNKIVKSLDELEDFPISIESIANSLSKQCRFAGHCDFYPVSQHSVNVAKCIEMMGHSRVSVLCGLMHDATESVISDIPTPIKRKYCIPVRDLEKKLMWYITKHFNLPWPLPEIVNIVDKSLGVLELKYFFPEVYSQFSPEELGLKNNILLPLEKGINELFELEHMSKNSVDFEIYALRFLNMYKRVTKNLGR